LRTLSFQTREHLKNCPEWKSQQKILWTTVLEETTSRKPGAGTAPRPPELFADERCSQAILEFLATTDVQSHRWQEQRPARPRSGTVGNARNGSQLLREEEERLGVEE